MATELDEEIVSENEVSEPANLDWEKIVHAVIDPLIERPDYVMIRVTPSRERGHIHLLIVAEDSDTARLVGKRGTVANALRDVLGIAPKAAGTNERVHIKFESFGEDDDK